MIFAGAGASVALGKPTTPQFLQFLSRKWDQFGRFRNYYIQCNSDKQLDAEYMRDWLENLRKEAEVLEGLLTNFPLGNPQYKSTGAQALNLILKQFNDLIRETYGEVDPEKAFQHYNPLLEFIQGHGVRVIPLFTTNYDLVIESIEGYDQSPYHVITGKKKKGARDVFDMNQFNITSIKSPTILLYKLHGSTDLWKNKNDSKIEFIRYGSSPSPDYEELMIYPTRFKFDQVQDMPFSFFYDKLGEYLNAKTEVGWV